MKITEVLRNKDAKVLLSNFISLYIVQLTNLAVPLITLPYLIKTIGLEQYGVISMAFALVVYFEALTDFSFKVTATRDVSVFRDSQIKLRLIYSKVMMIKAITFLISVVVFLTLVVVFPIFKENSTVYLLTLLTLLAQVLLPDWFFQGIEKLKRITIINLVIRLLFVSLIFVFIKNESDFWIYPLLIGSGAVVSGLIGQFILLKEYNIKFVLVKRRSIVQTINSNVPIFINQFLPTLYNSSGALILGFLHGSTDVGVYSATRKIVDLTIAFLTTISRVFFPFLSRNNKHFSIYRNLMLITSGVLFVSILVFSNLILAFFNISHPAAWIALLLLALGIFGFALNNIYGLNYFAIIRQDKILMRNTLSSSLIGLLLSFPFIFYYGITGTAINLTFSRFLMGGGLLMRYLKSK